MINLSERCELVIPVFLLPNVAKTVLGDRSRVTISKTHTTISAKVIQDKANKDIITRAFLCLKYCIKHIIKFEFFCHFPLFHLANVTTYSDPGFTTVKSAPLHHSFTLCVVTFYLTFMIIRINFPKD